ncbi:hypothetical protein [Sorangium cellulosum]|uniref:hypothetical protein n=1 Tax=Sorangium cellulosum TaxID=56 RepID=UPI0013311B65|nr:hypothetical protein [Sorangium cellulosum]
MLSCAPVGLQAPLPEAAPAPGADRAVVATVYGEVIEIVADAAAPARDAAAAARDAAALALETASDDAAPPPGDAAPAKGGAAPASGAARRTHNVLFRPPFDLRGEALRLDATDLALGGGRGAQRVASVPLLGASGEVALLVLTEASELLLRPQGARALPAFEPRRGAVDGAVSRVSGLLLGPSSALVLGELRRRVALEEHTPEPRQPARVVGLDREELRGRPMTLAFRDDGAAGVLVLDGAAPEAAGAAPLDRAAGTAGEVAALAPWATLTGASDPRCRAMTGAWRALVALDPAAALRLDHRALPAIALGDQGLAQVRWGRERVCLEALHVVVSDSRRRGEAAVSAALVARWTAPRAQGGGAARGDAGAAAGVLRTPRAVQRLVCSVGDVPPSRALLRATVPGPP